MLTRIQSVGPGLAAAAGVAAGASAVAASLPSSWHVGAIPVSLVLGAAAANTPQFQLVAPTLKPGLALAASGVLRAGVICVGAFMDGHF